MGCWHPNYNQKLHRYKYLHGSIMMACGYCRWMVWWDNGYKWNWLYTGDGYHSAGLKICNTEDIQGFSNIPIRERVKFITDTMEYIMENSKEKDPQDTHGNTELAFNQTNPHVKFIHYNTVTPSKGSTPTKTVQFGTIFLLIATSFVFRLPNLKKKTTINILMIRLTSLDTPSHPTPLTSKIQGM